MLLSIIDEIDELEGVSTPLAIAILIVAALIIVVGIISGFISIWIAIRYLKYNSKKNSAGITGVEAARKILDDNGLQNIKVSVVGSLLFGNSYSHYFKKVRLRRFTRKKKSISSLAMGSQKAALAVMDKENDPAMVARIRLTPFTYFGPLLFLPIIIIGALLDYVVFNGKGFVTIVAAVVGVTLYLIAFIFSILALKTEKKAQEKAIQILHDENMATTDEIEDIKSLFHLYNIQYVNDMILAMLELIYRVLMIIAKIQQSSSKKSN